MNYKILLLVALILVSSCMIKNKPWYLVRTYSEINLEDNKYLFFLEGDESLEVLKDLLLLRNSEAGLERGFHYFTIESEESGVDQIVSRGYFWRIGGFEARGKSSNVVTRIVRFYNEKKSDKKMYVAEDEIKRIKSIYSNLYLGNVSQSQIESPRKIPIGLSRAESEAKALLTNRSR